MAERDGLPLGDKQALYQMMGGDITVASEPGKGSNNRQRQRRIGEVAYLGRTGEPGRLDLDPPCR
jgi:hypothetical protein